MKNRNLLILLAALLLGINACKKPQPVTPDAPDQNTAQASGVYVLNEGLWQMNNTTLSYYDFVSGRITEDIFSAVNNRGLGDTGSDLKVYGSKMYCVVNISESIEIMSLDARSIRQISLASRQPRRIAFYQGNAFVCCYDGSIIKIDTTSLEITGIGQAGSNPDGICVANGKLYVSNSGGLNYPDYGHTVSVMDPSSLAVLKEIEVALNPSHILADDYGDVYVLSNGNYADVLSVLQRINSSNDEVVQIFDFPISNFTLCNDLAYIYSYNYNTMQSQIKVLNVASETIVNENFISDGTQIVTPYGIAVNPANGDVYISDAYQYTSNGDVYCFGSDGKMKFKFEAGLNPSKIVVLP
ncbi:MAG: hypothetical protein MJZ72_00710 [Bacteroidales bacterium]|nr:hypothetical protein [Bacteroidales bacterium]